VRTRIHALGGAAASGNELRYERSRDRRRKEIHELRRRERTLIRAMRAHVDALQEHRTEITDWIESLPLQMCPVDGPNEFVSSFGDPRPGPPPHPHQGNDIMAATGTPIVAPFDGNAVTSPNDLGGQAVIVYGDQGYVYNAHLSAYGKLGKVQAGDVIGYVGSTGNATAPHDHFEWHPGDGDAVDPYELLLSVC
jgi:murein DD-endopeptidase MepM/ murein hydrolase activator NlpD